MVTNTGLAADTIVALATPSGYGGVGILRLSGGAALKIAQTLVKITPQARQAHFTPFYNAKGHIIDQGIMLWFPAPHSYTGEEVVELQGHGGPIVMASLLKCCYALGARAAQPGEFSQRAYLNDKMDLVQAEAIADLIHASSEQAAQSAMQSLQGAFSQRIEHLRLQLLELRVYVEASIDFVDEDIDFLSQGQVHERIRAQLQTLGEITQAAQQGRLLQEGIQCAIAGRPNTGKSSLLNALAEQDTAIVTDIAGTTRDLLRERITLAGMPLNLIDTAGLRDTEDTVEQIGIARAKVAVQQADLVLLLTDVSCTEKDQPAILWQQHFEAPMKPSRLLLVVNKIDTLSECCARKDQVHGIDRLWISAKTGEGLPLLKESILQMMGVKPSESGVFSARARHLHALNQTQTHLEQAESLFAHRPPLELIAEELRLAEQNLGDITGKNTPDELLGHIFSSFCIGK